MQTRVLVQVFFSCSPARIQHHLSKILSAEAILTNPNTGKEINLRNNVVAAVMIVGSGVTKVVATLLAEFGIPVISGSASSPDLDDRVNFPYFLRTVASDVEQATGMAQIAQRLDWNYLSLLYVTNNYGSKGKEAFMEEAGSRGICVADKPEPIPDVNVPDSSLREVYTRLQNYKSGVVVYYGTEKRIEEFLSVINNSSFIFLASEDWGDRTYMLDVGGLNTLGSITMKFEVSDIDVTEFKKYISNMSAASVNASRNPWMHEFWEDHFQCDLDSTITHLHASPCAGSLRLSSSEVESLSRDQRVVHVIQAIRVLFKGARRAKLEFCSYERTFPCADYQAETHVADFVHYLRDVRLLRGGQEVRVFDDNGNGNIGFDVYNVQTDGSGLYYRNVSIFTTIRTYIICIIWIVKEVNGLTFLS